MLNKCLKLILGVTDFGVYLVLLSLLFGWGNLFTPQHVSTAYPAVCIVNGLYCKVST